MLETESTPAIILLFEEITNDSKCLLRATTDNTEGSSEIIPDPLFLASQRLN